MKIYDTFAASRRLRSALSEHGRGWRRRRRGVWEACQQRVGLLTRLCYGQAKADFKLFHSNKMLIIVMEFSIRFRSNGRAHFRLRDPTDLCPTVPQLLSECSATAWQCLLSLSGAHTTFWLIYFDYLSRAIKITK